MKLEFKYTNELVNSLLKIEKYKTALDYLLLPTREKQKLMYEAKLKKTHFSTSIEGNVLSYNQVERVIANKKDNRITAEQEVQNYWDALTYLEEEKKKNTKIDMEFILKLHDIIQKKGKLSRIPFRGQTPPGVLFSVYDSISKQAEYIPPEWIDIEPLINELVNWYDNNQDLPVPILSAIMHYAVVTIHPFTDGNGRTSRALSTYVLMQHDYDFKGFNSFEEYYMSDLNGYYESIQMGLPALYYSGRENPPHPEIWINYFLRMVKLYSGKVCDLQLASEEEDFAGSLSFLKGKEKELLLFLMKNYRGEFTPIEISRELSVTNKTVINRLTILVKNGFVIPILVNKRIRSYELSEFTKDHEKKIIKAIS